MSKTSRRARVLRKTLGAFISDPEVPLAEQRASLERADKIPRPRGLDYVDTEVGGVAAIVATPKRGADERHILYLHGGGYVLGSPRSHIAMAARLALAARGSTTVLDYRLAPEHPYPAAIDDCVAAYRAIIADRDPSSVVIAGDSAGGGATLATLLALREAGVALPGAAYLMSPWTDLTASGESTRTKSADDPMLQAPWLQDFAEKYAGDQPLDLPGISPLFADLSGLPPMLVQVGSDEILLSDSTRLVEAARAAGVMVDVEVAPNMWHVFQAFAGMMPEATTALVEAAAFIRAKTPTPDALRV
ncbi:alpha/beta hydrolase [Ilumatobacter coccineus]|uniref:Putative esterase n=1 Tax=Ilumatobacter coccineus (strain NBRC 103263 / KCTC 29153 / YM16-304) TaxID=1313172 RepID=A0A6C7E418_ILUCY|nr:alpha/beta hydrolase [Ilumatobacter coccineus]BAN02644.1 putative esterase [Ilumatobacter coccineus YM16-304]